MSEELLNTLLLIGSLASLVSYLPQLWKLLNMRSRAEELSIITSLLWVYGSGVTALYAVSQTDDIGMIVSALVNFTGCMALLSLIFFNRHFKSRVLGLENVSFMDILKRLHRRKARPTVSLVRGHVIGAGPLPGPAAAQARPEG